MLIVIVLTPRAKLLTFLVLDSFEKIIFEFISSYINSLSEVAENF